MRDNMANKGFRIGEMSRQTGVNIETIRYYERITLMTTPDRTAGGTREYNFDQLKRLFFIKRCRELGFGIAEIRAFLGTVDGGNFTCSEINDLTADHLTFVQEKISNLIKLEGALKAMLAECSKGNMPDCPIVDSLFEAV